MTSAPVFTAIDIPREKINALPPDLRAATIQRVYENGASVGQIARHMGISTSRVHMIIKQAKRKEQWKRRSAEIIKDAGYVNTVQKFMDLELEAFDFAVRPKNCLKNEGFVTVGDVVTTDEKDLMKIPNFGKKSLQNVRDVLSKAMDDFGLQPQVFEPVVLNFSPEQRQEINRIVNDLRKVMTVGWSSEAYLRDAIISLQRMVR
jgi:DNA-directed RNA polymerase subunit alpha